MKENVSSQELIDAYDIKNPMIHPANTQDSWWTLNLVAKTNIFWCVATVCLLNWISKQRKHILKSQTFT